MTTQQHLKAALVNRGITPHELARRSGIPVELIRSFLQGAFTFDLLQQANIIGALAVEKDKVFKIK